MTSKFWTSARLITTAAVVAVSATGTTPAQDWIPFQVAGRLAPIGEWQALYPRPTATSLFDVTARYREVARSIVTTTGETVSPDSLHTAFVSPPPAAFAVAPFSRLTWPADLLTWRLSLAIPVVLTLLVVGVAIVDPVARARWSWICLAATPLLYYTVHTGQPSAWLLVAAAFSVLPATRRRDIAGGVALGLGVVFKATPILVVAGLWFGGRRRLAAIAASVTVLGSVATLPWSGDAWTAFFRAGQHLAGVVIPDWNNASFDAALVRLTAGATTLFTEPGPIVNAGAWAVRLAIIGLALRAALDDTRAPAHRTAAVWIGWLASTPLLWLHYLVAIVPIAGAAPGRRIDPALVVVAATSAIVVGRVGGLGPVIAGLALAGVWLAAAAWLLSNRCWNPGWRSQS